MKGIWIILILMGVSSLLITSSVSATNCWEYDSTDSATCVAAGTGSDCSWDEWGKYCMEKGCWDYMTETVCGEANATGCFWQTDAGMGWDTGWCEESASCWGYSTNATCVAASGCLWKSSNCQGPPECSGLASESDCIDSMYGCWWDSGNYCYKPSSWDYKTETSCADGGYTWKSNAYCTEVGGGCWDYSNQTACEAASCGWDSWGQWCYQKGCWDYNDNTTCLNASSGKCAWNNISDYCYEKSCGNYWDNGTCSSNPDSVTSGCSWTTQGECQNPSCSDFTANGSATCATMVGCTWLNSTSSCTQEGCWNYWANDSCGNITGCYWKTPSCQGASACSSYSDSSTCWDASESCWWDYGDYCSERSCWDTAFSINQTTCENATSTYGLTCEWDSYNSVCNEKWCGSYSTNATCSAASDCYWDSASSWCFEESCWGIPDSTSCENRGCSWGNWTFCTEAAGASCYDLDQTACINATNNVTCKWDQWSSQCRDRGCWDLTTNATCLSIGANLSVSCAWTQESGGWCEESGAQCWEYYTNATCSDNNCTWDPTWSTCYERGCWNYWTNDTCSGDSSCQWSTGGNWGWCEKRSCWNWDGMNSGNETACVNNTYNLNCTWQDASAGEGMCFGDWNLNCWQHEVWNGGNEANCTGAGCVWENSTGWCYEEAKSFSDFNTEGDCLMSGWGMWNGTECTDSGSAIENPGCWVFDDLADMCTKIQGCTYNSSSGSCSGLDTAGVLCDNITNQTLCAEIPMLGTCCKWQAGSCSVTYDTACWDQMAEPPAGATHCMDFNAVDSSTLCTQIAGDPWYMPCKWNNVTSQCGFKDSMATDVADIKTKKNCEFLGGVWKTETICDSTNNLPTLDSWCEMSVGGTMYGCDVSCWSCNSSSACTASKKGYCIWNVDNNSQQGGFCDIPQYLEINGDCDNYCGSCEHYSGGDSTPQKACKSSKAQCKWDNATSTCVSKKSKSCSSDCFSCSDKNTCTVKGGGSQGTCKWNDADQMCTPATFDGEICFDAMDNDNDGETDCNDPECIFDPFCGGGSMGQCWLYLDNSSCSANDCAWFQDPWTKNYICGMKGESCWMYETNQTGCAGDANCQWFSDDHCEINKSKSDACFSYTTQTRCETNSACKWKADQFSPQSGWCEFTPFECDWNSTLQQSKTACESNSFCSWNIDPWSKEGRCSPKCFAMNATTGAPLYATNSTCTNAISGGLCEWISGWCEPNTTVVGAIKGSDCAQYDNDQTQCAAQPGCAWFEQMMGGPGSFGGPQCNIKNAVDCKRYKNQTTCDMILQNGSSVFSGEGDACRWVTDNGWSWCSPLGEHCGPLYSPFCLANGTCYNVPQTNQTTCEADPYCIYQEHEGQSGCSPACFNTSLDMTTCQAIANGTLCNWAGFGGGGGQCDWVYCENSCQGGSPPADCATRCAGCASNSDVILNPAPGGASAGASMGGWCDPAGSKEIFEQMEGGRPHEVAVDDCGEAGINEWNDACFLGMKEMSDDYGFGIGLSDMTYAAACNGETLWDGSTGSGYKATKGYLYLDTDGNETNGCYSDNGAQNGFEFKFIAIWKWSDGGLSETLTAKRCLSGNWSAAKISLDTHRKKMCSEMQGMMITIRKSDLKSLPNLFNPANPMRMYGLTAGENGTAASPTDSIGPGYYQPGMADFKMEDCGAIGNVDVDGDGFFAYEDPDCKYIYMDESKGFRAMEDCFTSHDDDMDGMTNCDDEDCKYEPICGGTLAANSSDHSTPSIRKRELNVLMNSVKVTYITSERSNGTLLFYNNDTTCTANATSIRDPGLWNADNSDEMKFVTTHKAKINNDTDNVDRLNNSLAANTTYYYKLKFCDISDNCAVTGCLNFTTKTTASTTTMKFDDPDSGESWLIDTGGAGNYSAQGAGCAAATNSSLGEQVNPETVDEISIKTIRNTSSSAAATNITLEIEGIDTSSDVISTPDLDIGTATGNTSNGTEQYVWMNESGWGGESGVHTQGAPDNLTFNFPGNDSELWDCEDLTGGVLSNCTNISSQGERLYNSTTNVTSWLISNPPADLFSYISDQSAAAAAATDDTTPAAGGGGSAGGAAAATETEEETTEETTEEEAAETVESPSTEEETTTPSGGEETTPSGGEETLGSPVGSFFGLGGSGLYALMAMIAIVAIFAGVAVFKKKLA